ncbi:hypothetical protein [Chryseobacterium sp.]|uniref:hypothetical protein n=1 Tax=Chryseobacterium sp. TaxID=1871047 RepID=UPI0025C4BAA1|nr:hypothetical protein [Chryseobacterium sp.]
MTLDDIKLEALQFKAQNNQELCNKIIELKNKKVSFLGCIYFIQHNQQVSLAEARKLTLELEVWSPEEKNNIETYHQLMISEFKEDKE